jgi:transposase
MTKTFQVDRLDHLGVISCIIKDLGLVEMIDKRLGHDKQEEISHGEAIMAMILNGLGFSNRPLSLTPQFFEKKPLDLLFREDVDASMFNRFKLGRTLDKSYDYSCSLLFHELAMSVCKQEKIDLRFNDLDTTSFSLTGEYLPDSDENAIQITHGYSKDHRPDLKQAVLEMIVSQDGGIPFLSKSWDGNSSDNTIFGERAKALITEFKNSPTPRYLVADSKLYTEENAKNLKDIGFITRIPENIKLTSQIIEQALDSDNWNTFDEKRNYQCVKLSHYRVSQRWIVVSSDDSLQRAEKTVTKQIIKEKSKIDKELFHLQAQRFESPQEAEKELKKMAKKWKLHAPLQSSLKEYKHFEGKGRPKPEAKIKSIEWKISTTIETLKDKIEQRKKQKSCFILGSNIPIDQLSDEEIIQGYRGQSHVERGFRFLKEPSFFVSSLFVKKTSRIEGLLMVMTLSLLIYSVAQRRLRSQLLKEEKTLPNQIKQKTQRPTMRWVFQILEGIHRVKTKQNQESISFIEGLNDTQMIILKLFGKQVSKLYQIST